MTDIEKIVTILDHAEVSFIMAPDPDDNSNEEYIDLPGGTRLYFDENGTLVDVV